ncbi:cation:proton antiporter [Saccharothrix algeriensis]|uniref:CPA2 family monovalent cation:H+ antiporter-2 n=1 Tax=Saccharothrix algeriensis TaxID=173560 RepID=A0A8T8HXH6_9PSEU|nr:cation:proton antiporter [Saccharothrix algeriensis]MBM7814635.1 CPA2 family monovalent cation:H+ antiporter-2 [Saccharothrix algeriensis]QTR02920.1 cation:proton antiporter [Saccharothrix algeriensis]
MHTSLALLLELGLILVALSALGTAARRFGLPAIPLYLVAGLALGEGGIAPAPAAGGFVEAGASIGVVLLLLTLGLEFSTAEFTHSLRRHVPSAALDLLLGAGPGAVAGWLLGLDAVGVLALAGATWVSSSGVIARLLGDLRRLGNRETPAVLAVLVMEDFAMAVYLPVLAVLVAGGTWWQAALGVLVAVTAVAGAFLVAHRFGRHVNRWLAHPDAEQLMLRVLGVTLVVAALAEFANVSAAVGAFLVGLTLTGEAAERTRRVLSPLRDLFAAAFFLAIGFAVSPAELLPGLPVALALAAVGAAGKVATGWYAARRDGSARRGRLRAGTALIARGEFSVVISGLVGATHPGLGPLITAYVLVLATSGPLITRWLGAPAGSTTAAPR